ncbi:TonB-dependent receptor (plasmid) [Methylocystis sp. MJC1]|uniref:TonB-dependent receptor n=1 Tax=Methylocystis sp. MJC1 TaxID=2654282 RepID=UPI0013EC9F8B|nr:TonB-dependent receptor [Methylocystis sp. MJC1]KAF2989072.1 Vitamin B12 transporter BtuB [Methylocystis sp. MJC1]MBU6529148.1 TonB-dependent receptor [Methylocystis sp. MJC1]UZX14078.1 TonB-dependent receptor [Methylocystis sp. MJC1]
MTRTDRPGDPLFTAVRSRAPNPMSSVGREGIRLLGGPAQASSYKPLDLLPSVIEDSGDPFGLSFNRSITVRGVSDFFLSRNINGLPIAGIVGGADLVDLNNVAEINLYRGSLQANQGLGFSSAAGSLDLRVLAPQEKSGGTLTQAAGSNGFWRTYGRIDTGRLASGGAIFVSGSLADANKWKGEGDARRENVMLGVSQPIGDKLNVNLYLIHNDQRAYSYSPLSFAQTQNLAKWAWYDYTTAFTGKPATDVNNYQFNRVRHVDNVIFSEISYNITPTDTLILKPYYWRNQGYQLTTAGARVQLWPINNYNIGGVAEYHKKFPWDGHFLLGYWGQSTKPEPPPLGQRLYNVTPFGAMQFANYSTLARLGNHEFYSPFLQYTQDWGPTTISGGVRLLIQGTPEMQYFKTAGLPDVSYGDVWAYGPAADPAATAKARYFHDWLPNLGIRHQLSDEWSVNASYSRKTGRPDWGPQASSFNSAEASFLKKGMTLQSLMNMIRPEMVDAVDFGARYQSGNLTVVPTFFGFWTHKKEVLVFDAAVGQSYYQSNAATTGYGVEIETAWRPTDWLTLTGSLTAASETYKANIATGSNSVALIGGKQAPYAPKYQAKFAVTYYRDGFQFTPVIRYVSTRYGLADNSQSVSPYCVVDLNASYEINRKISLPVSLTLDAGIRNLFDTRYIGAISVNETNLNSTSYFAGPPRTIFAGLTAKF